MRRFRIRLPKSRKRRSAEKRAELVKAAKERWRRTKSNGDNRDAAL